MIKIDRQNECVRVVIRCRPLSSQEENEGRALGVQVDRENGEILVQKGFDDMPKRFTFDSVYPMNSKQVDIFEQTAFPIIENILEGYNGTIFAYGQTGTGKTHTMVGLLQDEDEKGIIPRAFEQIFKMIGGDTSKQFLV